MDAFKTLMGGTRFDRKRFHHDMQPFEPNKSTDSSHRIASTSTSALPSELDFLGTTASQDVAFNPAVQDEHEDEAHRVEPQLDRAAKKKLRQQQRQQHLHRPTHEEEQQAIDYSALLRTRRIKFTGDDVPNPIPSLSALPPSPSSTLLQHNWSTQMGLGDPTGVQMSAWAVMLQNRDLLACAPTGSGKTLSFLLPLFLLNPALESSASVDTSLATKTISPRSIVLEPTRELAMQVWREASALGQGGQWSVHVLGEGGVGVVEKKKEKKGKKSRRGNGKKVENESEDDRDEEVDKGEEQIADGHQGGVIDILITTPLRLIYAIKSGLVSVSSTAQLVLDESDKLFELNFLSQTDDIISHLPQTCQKAMFSATLPSTIEELAKTVMKPSLIRAIVGHKDSANERIDQELLFVGAEDHKLLTLRTLIAQGKFTPPVLIFVQSILRAKELATELVFDGINADTIHADRTSEERDEAVRAFAQGKVWCLIATDVLGRGVDFKGVKLVINYDFPQSAGSYIHRIGRTGRAGKEGKAITFFTKVDAPYLKMIVNVMRASGCTVPAYMLQLKAPSQDDKKRLRLRPVGRKDISRTNGAGHADEKDRKVKKRNRVLGGQEGVFKKRKEKIQVDE